MSRLPDAYECSFCGAEYDTERLLDRITQDDDGNCNFRCQCGSTEYIELFECKLCHGLVREKGNRHVRWWRVCKDCLGAVVNEYNNALDGIAEDYRTILEKIYDIRKIEV